MLVLDDGAVGAECISAAPGSDKACVAFFAAGFCAIIMQIFLRIFFVF